MSLVRRLLGRSAPSVSPESPPEYATVELRGGDTRVVIVPTLGGRIIEMEMAGRQWLSPSDLRPPAPGGDGSYASVSDGGGYDECFPTSSACTIPEWVKGYAGTMLPEHGELWSRRPELSLESDRDGARARTTWSGERLPYRLSRTVVVDSTGTVSMEFVVENLGASLLPFVWSPNPLFPLRETTRVVLGGGGRVRVWRSHGVDIGGERREHWWPRVRIGDKLVDLSVPWALGRSFSCKLYVEVAEGWAAIEEPGARLSVRFDPRLCPSIGLWINRGGWAPRARTLPWHHVSLQPSVGMPDSLAEALGWWDAAQWLQPGEQRQWSIHWEARRIRSEAT